MLKRKEGKETEGGENPISDLRPSLEDLIINLFFTEEQIHYGFLNEDFFFFRLLCSPRSLIAEKVKRKRQYPKGNIHVKEAARWPALGEAV